MADPGDFLCAILELLGMSTEKASERGQAIALLVCLAIFGLIAGSVTDGLASQLWFGLAGLASVLLAIALCLKI